MLKTAEAMEEGHVKNVSEIQPGNKICSIDTCISSFNITYYYADLFVCCKNAYTPFVHYVETTFLYILAV